MKSFNEYITEQQVPYHRLSLPELAAHIKAALEVKQIVNVDYNSIKTALSRKLESEYDKSVKDKYRGAILAKILDGEDSTLSDLYWQSISDLRSFGTLKKLLAKVKNPTSLKHPFVKDVSDWINSNEKLVNDFNDLKQYVVKASALKAVAKQAKEQAKQAKFRDASYLVKVLETHLNEFVRRAGEEGGTRYDKMIKVINDAGGLDAYAPEPNTRLGREQYMKAKEKRDRAKAILSSSREKFVKMYTDAAHMDYMKWIVKMTEKIGTKVLDAQMTGSPWVNSVITITDQDGNHQIWHTKMIINTSKYGKPFNQFPTTRKK